MDGAHLLGILHITQDPLELGLTWAKACPGSSGDSQWPTLKISLPSDLMIAPTSLTSTVLFCSWSKISKASMIFLSVGVSPTGGAGSACKAYKI